LKKWYLSKAGQQLTDDERAARLKLIQDRFLKDIKPQFKTDTERDFLKGELNNARLLQYELYVKDLADFENLFIKLDRNFGKFIEYCKKLEDIEHPEQAIKAELAN
jgi:hypothetical protein